MSNAEISITTNQNIIRVSAEHVDRCEGRVLRYWVSVLTRGAAIIAQGDALSSVQAQEIIDVHTDETHHTARRIVDMATAAAEFTDSLASAHNLSEFQVA